MDKDHDKWFWTFLNDRSTKRFCFSVIWHLEILYKVWIISSLVASRKCCSCLLQMQVRRGRGQEWSGPCHYQKWLVGEPVRYGHSRGAMEAANYGVPGYLQFLLSASFKVVRRYTIMQQTDKAHRAWQQFPSQSRTVGGFGHISCQPWSVSIHGLYEFMHGWLREAGLPSILILITMFLMSSIPRDRVESILVSLLVATCRNFEWQWQHAG